MRSVYGAEPDPFQDTAELPPTPPPRGVPWCIKGPAWGAESPVHCTSGQACFSVTSCCCHGLTSKSTVTTALNTVQSSTLQFYSCDSCDMDLIYCPLLVKKTSLNAPFK